MSWNCFGCLKTESSDIKSLNYEHCTLNDVPAEVFAFERTLEELYLDSNRIRDLPRPLFHCHGLKVLSLSDNEVHSLPPAIASLINLQHLDVSRNALNSIPDNLKGCKYLTYVDVSVNPLEKLPEGFTQLISLEELYLNDTYLDFLPANFGRLMRLRILELRENNLNTLPKSIARLAHLQRLDIGQNDFSDVPEVIGNLPNLTELWIDSNRIRCIPPLIGNLKKLVHLEASNNNICSIASEVEHCGRLVDLTLTCNELSVLPHSIGNLKELVTLKVDDNQLSALPNSIGKLSNLQELILSQNDLESLPACIGLLRKLHILNVDDNMLEELPPEIGSCTSLTILSAHSNKLQQIPAEIGHLSNLRVVNLSENHLQNLPVSILNLMQLTALWLSNNQSTPLTTLQQELDKQTGQMVCTNFMLPQSAQETSLHEEPPVRCEVCTEDRPIKTKPHITFATDADAEAPSRLLRAPTPYPKELRAMAKHARAMHHFKRSSKESDEDTPVLEEMVSQEPKDLLIKEAKVKKPSTDTVGVPGVVCVSDDKNVDVLENEMEFKGFLDSSKFLQDYVDVAYSKPMGDMSSIVGVDCGPVVREAKCVRKMNTNIPEVPLPALDTRQRQSVASTSDQTLQQPPPYHIAAAYSKQAAFFMHKNSPSSEFPAHFGASERKSKDGEGNEKEKSEQTNHESELSIGLNAKPSNEGVSVNVSQEITAMEDEVIGDQVVETESVAISDCEKLKSSDVDQCTEENISNEVTFLSSISTDVSHEVSSDNENSGLRKFKKDNTLDSMQCENENRHVATLEEDVKYACVEMSRQEKVHQNSSQLGTDVLGGGNLERHQEDVGEVLLLQKPQTFTQDKPVVREGVVAPTPQRPRSASFGAPNAPSSDDKVDVTISLPPASTPNHKVSDVSLLSPVQSPPKISGIPKAVRSTGFPSVTNISHLYTTEEGDALKQNFTLKQKLPHSYDLEVEQKLKKAEVWQPHTSAPVTRIPVQHFHSPRNQSQHTCNTFFTVSHNQDTSLNISSSSALNNTSNKIANVNQNFLKLSQPISLTDCNLHELSNKSQEQIQVDPYGIRNGSFKERAKINNHHVSGSKIPTLGQSVDLTAHKSMRSGYQSRIPAPVNSPNSLENQKASKVWMFGPHKNATVFPVTIQKNSGLGFSISGGVKTPVTSERFENEIYVTKVHPSGPANGLIMPGDKILEVDGIDFTKLEHDEAVTILKQTGNIVNMMISRQQT